MGVQSHRSPMSPQDARFWLRETWGKALCRLVLPGEAQAEPLQARPVFPGAGWLAGTQPGSCDPCQGPPEAWPSRQARPGVESQAWALACANLPVFGLERGGGPAAAGWALPACLFTCSGTGPRQPLHPASARVLWR